MWMLVAVCGLVACCLGVPGDEDQGAWSGAVVRDDAPGSGEGELPEDPDVVPPPGRATDLGSTIVLPIDPTYFIIPVEPPTPTICVAGSTRYCDTTTYCSWGEQRCNDDGSGWGYCYEASPPAGCSGYYYDQDCCEAVGACCQDWYDSDGDGNSGDSVGDCG
jgi:hypothetical protein